MNKKFGHVLLVATSEWMRKKTPCWSVDLAKNNLVIAIWNYYHRQQSYTILTIDNDDDDDQPSSRLYGFDHSSHSFIHWIQFIVMNNNDWFMFSSTLHYHHVYGIWNWVKKNAKQDRANYNLIVDYKQDRYSPITTKDTFMTG